MTNIYRYMEIVANAASRKAEDAFADELQAGVLFVLRCSYDIDKYEQGIEDRILELHRLASKGDMPRPEARERLRADDILIDFVLARRREMRFEAHMAKIERLQNNS